jgi:hypothetical protein
MPVIELQAFEDAVIRTCGRRALRSRGAAGHRVAALVPALVRMAGERRLIRPAVAYEVRAVAEIKGGTIRFADGTALVAPGIPERLGAPEALAVGVATIGPALEAAVTQLFAERKPLKAYALNEIGNAALFKLGQDIRCHLQERAEADGRTTSSPLFPGSPGFGLEAQETLVRMAGADRIGVTYERGGGLAPGKSLSMTVGLGRAMPVWHQDEDCARCGARTSCRHRTPEGAGPRDAVA